MNIETLLMLSVKSHCSHRVILLVSIVEQEGMDSRTNMWDLEQMILFWIPDKLPMPSPADIRVWNRGFTHAHHGVLGVAFSHKGVNSRGLLAPTLILTINVPTMIDSSRIGDGGILGEWSLLLLGLGG